METGAFAPAPRRLAAGETAGFQFVLDRLQPGVVERVEVDDHGGVRIAKSVANLGGIVVVVVRIDPNSPRSGLGDRCFRVRNRRIRAQVLRREQKA